MAISGIGYTQTYYYNPATNEFTSKDKGGEAIAESLNGEGNKVHLADFEKQQKSLLETFLRIQEETGNRWDRYRPADGQEGVYEITYVKENELEAAVYVGEQEAFRQMATFCLPGTFNGDWDYMFPEKEFYNREKNSVTVVPGDVFTLKNGSQIEIGKDGVSVRPGIDSREDAAYAEKMAAAMNEFIKTANRGCFNLTVSMLGDGVTQDILDIVAQTGIDLSREFMVNGTRFAVEDGQLCIKGEFAKDSKVWEREAAWRRGAMRELLHDEFGMSDEEIETEMAKYPSAVPKKGDGAPYSYLADENGVIEYNGVVFTTDREKNWLCLGDVSNLDNVIRVPLSGGGCLMVNRNCIGALGRAIGMFSPEDINRILRALKMDAKVQEMKKEIEEMEDGIGKTNEQQYADSAEAARKAAKKNGNAGGFNGYGMNNGEEGVFRLKDWQLALLLGEEEDKKSGRIDAWYDPVMELAGSPEKEDVDEEAGNAGAEDRDERDY